MLVLAAVLQVALIPPVVPLSDLSADQRSELARGVPVQLLTPVAGSPWPRSRVYHLIAATPEQSLAVFSDYSRHEKFEPHVKESRVLSRTTPADALVFFEIDIPWYPNDKQRITHHIGCTGRSLWVTWHSADADADASRVDGFATFTPAPPELGPGSRTLMVYDQLVVPSSFLARIPAVRRQGIATAVEVARATEREIVRAARDSTFIAQELALLRAALPTAPSQGEQPCSP